MVIDSKTKEVQKEFYQEFDPKFLDDFMSERRAEKGRELSRYNLNQLEIRRDGGVVLIAEQFFVKQFRDLNSYNNPYGSPYYYNPRYFFLLEESL